MDAIILFFNERSLLKNVHCLSLSLLRGNIHETNEGRMETWSIEMSTLCIVLIQFCVKLNETFGMWNFHAIVFPFV